MRFDGRDVIIGLGLFLVAFFVRLIFASQLVFPPLDDPAFYIQTARNIAAGRGLVIDVIYNYWMPFNSITHPSHEYWMPLTSLVMAFVVRVAGDSLYAAQWVGVITGSLLPVLTYGMGRYLWPEMQRWSVLSALMLVPGAVLVYQSAAADSMGLYAALSATALFTAALAINRRDFKWAAASGALCGLSYLTRSHGSLLPIGLALVCGVKLRRDRSNLIRLVMAGALGYFVFALPWWLRNIAAFGSAQPIPLSSLAATMDNNEWYNYGSLPSLSHLDVMAAIDVRWRALWHNTGVLILITFPYGLIGLPLALIRRETLFRVFAAYAVLLLLGASLVIPSSGLSGSFYHSAGAFAIWAALGAVMVIRRLAVNPARRIWAVAATALIFALVIGQAIVAWPTVIADSRSNLAKFTAVTEWLRANVPPDQPIVTSEAHSLNYASGYSTLTLPNRQDVVTLRQLADRYGARYIVVFGSIGLYPAVLDEPAANARRVATLPDVAIYELLP